jgi:hypothetical protein
MMQLQAHENVDTLVVIKKIYSLLLTLHYH